MTPRERIQGAMKVNRASRLGVMSILKARRQFVVSVVVIAIVVPSLFAAYFYKSSQDYRGAKYRAQHLMVSDMSNIIENALYSIQAVLDHNLTCQNRSSSAHSSYHFMWHLDSLSSQIAIMYSEGSREAATFLHLEDAFDMSMSRLSVIGDDLDGPDHEIRTNLASALEASVPILMKLDLELLKALIDSRSTSSVPPSTVAHLDLAAADELAIELLNLMPWPP